MGTPDVFVSGTYRYSLNCLKILAGPQRKGAPVAPMGCLCLETRKRLGPLESHVPLEMARLHTSLLVTCREDGAVDFHAVIVRLQARAGYRVLKAVMKGATILSLAVTAWPAVANQALRTKAVDNERSTEAKERVRRVIRTCRSVLVRAAIVQPASDDIVQALRMPLGLEPLPLSRRQEEQIRAASEDMWLGSEPVNAARELKKDAARKMLNRCFSGEDSQHNKDLPEVERAMALLTADVSSIREMRLMRGPGGEPCAKEYRHKQSLQEMRKSTAACSAEGQSWLRQCCSKFKASKLLIVFDVGHVMGKITAPPPPQMGIPHDLGREGRPPDPASFGCQAARLPDQGG